VLAGDRRDNGQCASIHERVVFKQPGLDRKLQYDAYPRKSLIDLFYDPDTTLESVATGQAAQRGDFFLGDYEARIQRNPERIRVLMTREGNAGGSPVKIAKALTLSAGSSTLEIAYQLEGLPQERPLCFGVEMNFAGLPAGADDRYFYALDGQRLGHLGTCLDLTDAAGLGMADEWLGIDVLLKTSRPTHFWTYPVQTVSQSEGGFELVHQSLVLQPHWHVRPDADGRWSVTMHLVLDTSRAESRQDCHAVAAAT